jgi:hypothetical protein
MKKPSAWTGNSEALNAHQLKACIALGEAAKSKRGTFGKDTYKGVSMPKVAVEIAKIVPRGEGAHGGERMADRRTRMHAKADVRLDALRALLAKKGG